MSTFSGTWWFLTADVAPLAEHCLKTNYAGPSDDLSCQLLLWKQGDLVYLTTNSVSPRLVDLFDPSSQQRVYALGHAHHLERSTVPAD